MVELDPEHVSKAKKTICEDFPELADVEPVVAVREVHRKDGGGPRTLYVLSFQRSVSLPDGRSLARTVRMTMDQSGEIVMLVSSK